jgi:hypothetical protein
MQKSVAYWGQSLLKKSLVLIKSLLNMMYEVFHHITRSAMFEYDGGVPTFLVGWVAG